MGLKIMIKEIGYFGVKYLTECPVDAVRFVKSVPFDWVSQLGYMPKSLNGCYRLLTNLDEYASIKDLLDAGKELVRSLADLDELFAHDFLKGDKLAVRNAIALTSEALNVAAIFGSKLKVCSGVTASYLEIASSLVSIVKDLQDLYRILTDERIEGQQGIFDVSLSLARNSLSVSRSILEGSIRQYLMLSCGSVYSITKVTLFVLNNKN